MRLHRKGSISYTHSEQCIFQFTPTLTGNECRRSIIPRKRETGQKQGGRGALWLGPHTASPMQQAGATSTATTGSVLVAVAEQILEPVVQCETRLNVPGSSKLV